MKVSVQRLPHALGIALPAYATEGSAGMDLVAAVETDIELLPGLEILKSKVLFRHVRDIHANDPDSAVLTS